MESTEALELARELGAIPKFPSWSEPSVGAVATALEEWCGDNPQQAIRLVKDAIRSMPEWGGIPALHSILDSYRQSVPWSEPKHKCSLCDGTGYATAWEIITPERSSGGGHYKRIDVLTDPLQVAEISEAIAAEWKAGNCRRRIYPGVYKCRVCHPQLPPFQAHTRHEAMT